jgi:ribosomal protein S18 acetylase RimI-like enzyme/DNA gyrase inhibitor GyrI
MTKDHYGRVRVKTLEPMRIACYRAASATPEMDSIGCMREWLAKQKLGATSGARTFGFDADVTPEQQKRGMRGYEVWVSVPESVRSSGGVTVKDFAGGLYAVMKINDPFKNPFEVIPAGWNRLVGWVKTSDKYGFGKHQCLEEHVEGEGGTYLDIHLPVVKKKMRRGFQAAKSIPRQAAVDMLIRDARRDDTANISELSVLIRKKSYQEMEGSFYPREAFEGELLLYSPEVLGKYIGSPDRFAKVAEDGGRMVGLAIGKLDRDTGVADLGWIGVALENRHRGIARALMDGVCADARRAGCHKLIAFTMARLDSACAMYERCGFVREAMMKRHWIKIDFVMYSKWLE